MGFYRARASHRAARNPFCRLIHLMTLSLNYISNSQDYRALEIKADAPLHEICVHSSGCFAYSCANWED